MNLKVNSLKQDEEIVELNGDYGEQNYSSLKTDS